MKYNCKRCGYETDKISHFKRHLTKTILCPCIFDDISREILLDNLTNKNDYKKCEHCNKQLKNDKSLQAHFKNCKILPQNITNINSNNNINVNINIANLTIPRINNFLQEDLSHLTNDLIMQLARKMNTGLIDLIKEIRFNPEKPENMNVKLHTKRDKTLYVYQNDTWEISPRKWTIEDMILQGAKIINQVFCRNVDKDKLQDNESREFQIQSWLLSILSKDKCKELDLISQKLYAIILTNYDKKEDIIVLMQKPN